jgi:hypothetical protein
VVGFYKFVREGRELWLNDLWIEPAVNFVRVLGACFRACSRARASADAGFFIETNANL